MSGRWGFPRDASAKQMPHFVEAVEQRAGQWRVAVRWKREDPFEFLAPIAARERADLAERNGETELANELRSAAAEADRKSRTL